MFAFIGYFGSGSTRAVSGTQNKQAPQLRRLISVSYLIRSSYAWAVYSSEDDNGAENIDILRTNARITLADPMPRLCPDAVSSANVNGLSTRNRLSGPHREAIGRSSGNIKHV